jgi:Leu/Phe-tRNA-protein transferase
VFGFGSLGSAHSHGFVTFHNSKPNLFLLYNRNMALKVQEVYLEAKYCGYFLEIDDYQNQHWREHRSQAKVRFETIHRRKFLQRTSRIEQNSRVDVLFRGVTGMRYAPSFSLKS